MHKLGDTAVELQDIVGGQPLLQVDRYEFFEGDPKFKSRQLETVTYSLVDQQWFRDAMQSDGPRWFILTRHPRGERPAVAYAGPIDINQKRVGVLSIVIVCPAALGQDRMSKDGAKKDDAMSKDSMKKDDASASK